MTNRGFTVKALGEVAIRCRDLEAMAQFYGEVLGLPLLPDGHRGGIRFFALGESYGGHTAVLALFQGDGTSATAEGSSLHHLALTVDASEQDAITAWYEDQDRSYWIEDFDWIGWRGVFTKDPEGNTVELVAKRR